MSAAEYPWTAIAQPAAGELRRGTLRWDELPGPSELAYIAIRGTSPGPAVLLRLTPGRPSYPAIHALLRLAEALNPARVHGSLLLITQPLAAGDFGPFPGSAGGDARERRTHHLIRDVFAPADALIELAGHPPTEYGLGHALHHRPASIGAAPGDAGRIAAAAQLHYAVGADLSSDRRDAVGWFARRERASVRLVLPDLPVERADASHAALTSLTNMLRRVGVLRGRELETGARLATLAGVALAPADGLWDPAVQPGDRVERETTLGSMQTLTGEPLGSLIAVRAGVVLSVSMAVQVGFGDLLVRLVDEHDE